MTRSELYERVWQMPLRKLAPEFGVSDVGLGKLCRRMNIPLPGLGYWAKVEFGKATHRVPLPMMEHDVEVRFAETDRDSASAMARAGATAKKEAHATKRPTALPEVPVRTTLEGCHPLVAKTRKFFTAIAKEIERDRLERERPRGPRWEPKVLFGPAVPRTMYGRYSSGEGGELKILASLKQIDWILRFHDALLKGLAAVDVHVKTRPKGSSPACAEVHHAGERMELSFTEEFDKVEGRSSYLAEYRPRNVFRLRIEREFGGLKQWTGAPDYLEQLLPTIVIEFRSELEAQKVKRPIVLAARRAEQQRRDEAEARRRAWQAEQELIYARKKARAAQVARAQTVAEQFARHLTVVQLLDDIESRVRGSEAHEATRVWLAGVRAAIKDPVVELIAAVEGEAVGPRRALWWPDDDGTES